jgi:uncharacterized protein YndB with AHSA1/START domain
MAQLPEDGQGETTENGRMGHTRVTRVIHASPAEVYAALLDPRSVARWKVPDGMSSIVHELDPHIGGRLRVSLTYDAPSSGEGPDPGKTSARTDTYSGRFLELVPGSLVVEAVEFETSREEMRGEMRIRTTLTPVGRGTEVAIDHAALPPGVAPGDNVTGTRMALAKLAALLETGF